MEKANSKKKWFTAIIIILLVIAVCAIGYAVYQHYTEKKPEQTNGVVGKVYDNWDTGIEQEPQKERPGIQIPGYSKAVMKEGDTSLVLSVGNPKENNCGFYATLKLEDGTEPYKSELLKPGYGLTEIPLSQTLKSGEYTAILYYRCVTLDEEQAPLNSAESEFKLIVK